MLLQFNEIVLMMEEKFHSYLHKFRCKIILLRLEFFIFMYMNEVFMYNDINDEKLWMMNEHC